jgi:hypothetical protein
MVETSGRKGFELQCEGDSEGQRSRSTWRFYMVNGSMLVLSAMASPEDWVKNEKAINEVFASFSLIEAKAEPDKEEPAQKKEVPKAE